MNNTIEKLITLLVEQLEDSGDVSTGQGLKQDMNQPVEDVSGQPDGFRKDPVKELHDHEDRMADKTAKRSQEAISKLLTDHRKATEPQSSTIIKRIEKSNMLLKKVNDGIERQTSDLKDSYSRIEELNAAQNNENKINSALLEKLVSQTEPKPRKIREDVLSVKITNFKDLSAMEGKDKSDLPVGKLTPKSKKSEGADWIKWIMGAGLIAYILKEAFKGFNLAQWLKDQFKEEFMKGPDENWSGGIHGTKWAARMLKPLLAWGAKTGLKATWAAFKTTTGISAIQKSLSMAGKVTGLAKGKPPVTPKGKPPVTPKGKPPVTPKGKPPVTPKGKPPVTPKGKPLNPKNVPKSINIGGKLGTTTGNVTGKATAAVGKAAGKGGISLGKRLFANTPYIGIGISTAMGAWRQSTGDLDGAKLEYLSAALNAGSGVGGPAGAVALASSFAVDGYIVYRDWKRSKHWEELMEANEGYVKRVETLRKLTDGGKSISSLSNAELKEILGEDNWKKFTKNKSKQKIRSSAIEGVTEFKENLDKERKGREKMVQEVMAEMGDHFTEEDRPAIEAVLMAQAMAYSKEGQTDAIRDEYATSFADIIKNSGHMPDLKKEYARYSKTHGQHVGLHRNSFKGNLLTATYGDHAVKGRDGKYRYQVSTSVGIEHREFVKNADGSNKKVKVNGKWYDVMKKTGKVRTEDSPELQQFYEDRNAHMAPKIGKRTADSLKSAGFWPAFMEQMSKTIKGYSDLPLEEQERVLGMMVVKGWSFDNTYGGVFDVNLEETKHTKAFLNQVNKMAEGIRTGDGISRGMVQMTMLDRIRHAQSGHQYLSEGGESSYMGYLKSGGGHIGIGDLMSGDTPVPEDVKKWFVDSANAPPGSFKRQVIENMDHNVRRKLAGWEHMDSTGKRRFDEYWNNHDEAVDRYAALMSKYRAMTPNEVEAAKATGDWTTADDINYESARLDPGFQSTEQRRAIQAQILRGYGLGHYGKEAYGGIMESEGGLYLQRLIDAQGKDVGPISRSKYTEDEYKKAGFSLARAHQMAPKNYPKLTPEQLDYANALLTPEAGESYYTRHIKGNEYEWKAPKLPPARYIDMAKVKAFDYSFYPKLNPHLTGDGGRLLQGGFQTVPGSPGELKFEMPPENPAWSDSTSTTVAPLAESIDALTESINANQPGNTQVNNSTVNTTITTDGAVQIENNKQAHRKSPGAAIFGKD